MIIRLAVLESDWSIQIARSSIVKFFLDIIILHSNISREETGSKFLKTSSDYIVNKI